MLLLLSMGAPVFAMKAHALDASKKLSQYAHTAWRLQECAFQGEPQGITQTADGYIWIGTSSALVRFDGAQFTSTDETSFHAPVISLMGSRDGSLWIGTTSGLTRFKDGMFHAYPGMGRVNAIVEDNNGAIWMGRSRIVNGEGPICRVNSDALSCYGDANQIDVPWVTSMAKDKNGNLLIGSRGLFRWQKAGFISLGLRDHRKYSSPSAQVVQVVAGRDDLWAGTDGTSSFRGLKHYKNGVWQTYSTRGFRGDSLSINSLLLDHDGCLWIGTLNQGIYRIHNGRAEHFSRADGMSSDTVNSSFEEHEHEVWIATSKAVDRFRDLPVTTFSTKEGLISDTAQSVVAAQDGSIWVGTQNGLNRIKNGKITRLTRQNGFPGTQVNLPPRRPHRTLVGRRRFHDHDLRYGRFSKVNNADGNPIGVVGRLLEDAQNRIWVITAGSPTHLFRILDGKSIQKVILYGETDPLSFVRSSSRGGVWIAFRNGDLVEYDNKDNVISRLHRPTYTTRQLFLDLSSQPVAVTKMGLVRVTSSGFEVLNSSNGLACDDFFSALTDKDGDLWIDSKCGVVAIPRSEYEKWVKYPDRKVRSRLFDVSDGVVPGWPPFTPVASLALDGRLWLAQYLFVQVIDPSHLSTNGVVPPVHIQRLIADSRCFSPDQPLKLPRLTRDLEIDYTALSFVVPQKVHFRYKLDGWDKDWRDVGTRRQAFYTNLNPGKYVFRVIACNSDGVWNESGAVLQFYLPPAFNQTNWFKAACGIFVLAILWSVYRVRLYQATTRAQQRVSDRLSERERIARELHDTLLQGLNGLALHFQMATDLVGKNEPARPLLDNALQQSDRVIVEGRERVMNLRNSSIEDLAEAFSVAGEEYTKLISCGYRVVVHGEVRDLHRSCVMKHTVLAKKRSQTLFDMRMQARSKRNYFTGLARSVLFFETTVAVLMRAFLWLADGRGIGGS